MIKFFRKIRYDLMEKNKTGKYLKYAIGEILLVVIGIIIALQLNNWNESRNQSYKEIISLKALKSELQNDLNTEFIPGKNNYLRRNKSLSQIIEVYRKKDTISKDSLLNCFRRSITDRNFALNEAAFENLKSTGINLITNDSLRLKITSMYSAKYPEIMLRNNRLIQFTEREVRPTLNDNVDLYSVTLSQNEFDFLKNNKKISNRMFELYYLRRWMLEELDIIIPKLKSLLRDIDKEIALIEK